MAPSVLLSQEHGQEYTASTDKQQAKSSKVEGATSLESHAPVGGNAPINSSSTIGTNSTGSSNGSTNQNGHSATNGQSARDHFVTQESLLENSKNYASASGGPDESPKKPNILYIMADQMAAPLLKMNDPNSVIKTPNIDELASTGVVFSSAYCNSPLCAPSRFTMCTGQLPSKIGGYDNASVLSEDVPTYAHYLRREGYETVLAGKMHFIGKDQLHGFEHRYGIDALDGAIIC